MRREISDESRQAALKCTKGMSCLDEGTADLCPVEGCVDRKIYFVTSQQNLGCVFQKPFGNGQYCTCPVRKEIFDRYRS